MYKFCIILILLSFQTAFSKKDFSGKITESSSGNPLSSVSIRIENTQYGAYSNKEGVFVIKNLPDNMTEGRIIISMIGYETVTKEINLVQNNNITFELKIQPLQTGEVIVSASKKVQAIQDVPISVSVIDKRVLMDRGINRLDDALEYVPGVEVNQDNASIRGSSGFSFGVGSRVTLLIDGFPLTSGDNGDIKFDALPIFNIDRIEVVKGAGSALWGTGAIGGVINLILEEPKEIPLFKYRVTSGFYTQPRFEKWKFTDGLSLQNGVNLSYSQKINNFSFLASGNVYKDDSYRKYDENSRWNIFSKAGYEFSTETKLKLLFNASAQDRDDWVYWNSLDSATFPPYDTDTEISIFSSKYSGFGELTHIFDESNFGLIKFGINATNYYNSYQTDNLEYRQSKAITYYYEFQGVSNMIVDDRNLNLTYGFTQNYSDINSVSFGIRHQSIISGYAQAELIFPEILTLTLGGRLDKELTENLESDLEFSPKIGFNFPINENLSLRASAGHGFRVASVAERYASIRLNGFEVAENLGLKPEKSWSYEIGGTWKILTDVNPVEIDLSVFHNDLENMIEPYLPNDAISKIQFRNIINARIQGAELGIRSFILNTLGIETSLTLMNPRDLSNDKVLNYRSEVLWYTRFLLPMKYFEFQLDYRYKSRVENIDEELGNLKIINDVDARVDMNVVDARLIFDMKKLADLPLKITLNANNLLDYYYTEMVGNLARTRYISLQLDGEL